MRAEMIRHAIMASPRSSLDAKISDVWKASAAGHLTDAEAEELDGFARSRKVVPIERPAVRRVGSKPRTEGSLGRRRRWVAAGLLPPQVAAIVTMGESAALAVVAAEIVKRGACTLTVGAIAGAAGVSETTARNGIRAAREAGLITVRERRVSRWRNDTNVVAIVSPAWRTWLRMRPKGSGCRTVEGTPTKKQNQPFLPFAQVGKTGLNSNGRGLGAKYALRRKAKTPSGTPGER